MASLTVWTISKVTKPRKRVERYFGVERDPAIRLTNDKSGGVDSDPDSNKRGGVQGTALATPS